MKTVLPSIDEETRKRAIASSRAARRERAELKAAIGDGSLSFEEALEDPRAARVYVRDIIRSVRGIGPKRAEKVMVEIGIWGNRRVNGLGVNQRAELIEWARGLSRREAAR